MLETPVYTFLLVRWVQGWPFEATSQRFARWPSSYHTGHSHGFGLISTLGPGGVSNLRAHWRLGIYVSLWGPTDHINMRILHAGGKAYYQGDSRNHGFWDSSAYWSVGPMNMVFVSIAYVGACHAAVGILSRLPGL